MNSRLDSPVISSTAVTWKPRVLPCARKKRYIAFALEAQGEIRAHPQFFDPQTINQAVNECRRRLMAGLVVKRVGNDHVHTQIQQQLGALVGRCQIIARIDPLKHFVGMRIKCEDDRQPARSAGARNQALDQLLVAPMHAIKNANGQD